MRQHIWPSRAPVAIHRMPTATRMPAARSTLPLDEPEHGEPEVGYRFQSGRRVTRHSALSDGFPECERAAVRCSHRATA
jgi:hypothetical protein